MTTKQQDRKTPELTETELKEVSGGIIAVLRPTQQMGDGSVRPAAVPSENALIGLL